MNYINEITYVTGNWAKITSAKQILEPLGIKINHVKMETTEIQANTVEEVAMHSAKESSDKLKCTVLKNDTGLYIDALNGFPGPYTHYVDEKIGEDGILKLLKDEENRKAHFTESFAYCEYGKEPLIFKSITRGTIAQQKSGKFGWSWDFIFIPDGYENTMGNYPDEARFKMWDNSALYEIANFLKENKIEHTS